MKRALLPILALSLVLNAAPGRASKSYVALVTLDNALQLPIRDFSREDPRSMELTENLVIPMGDQLVGFNFDSLESLSVTAGAQAFKNGMGAAELQVVLKNGTTYSALSASWKILDRYFNFRGVAPDETEFTFNNFTRIEFQGAEEVGPPVVEPPAPSLAPQPLGRTPSSQPSPAAPKAPAPPPPPGGGFSPPPLPSGGFSAPPPPPSSSGAPLPPPPLPSSPGAPPPLPSGGAPSLPPMPPPTGGAPSLPPMPPPTGGAPSLPPMLPPTGGAPSLPPMPPPTGGAPTLPPMLPPTSSGTGGFPPPPPPP